MGALVESPTAGPGGGSLDTAMADAAAFLGRSLSSLLGTTFTELSHVASPDIGSRQFLSTYAAGAGIAMFVLVVMLARLFHRASSGDLSGHSMAESLWRWVPTAMLLVLFAPAVGQLIVQLTDAATASITGYFAADVGPLPGKLTSMVVISDPDALPGGPIVALLVMALAFVGLAGMVGGLTAQTLVLYLTGAVMAVSFVALIDPATRSRALRLPATWLALLLAKPLLFFLIGTVARISGSVFTARPGADPGWRILMPALMGALTLLFVGLAPWTLIRMAPRLPVSAADRYGRTRRGLTGVQGQAPSATMRQMSHRRMSALPVPVAGPPGPTAVTGRPVTHPARPAVTGRAAGRIPAPAGTDPRTAPGGTDPRTAPGGPETRTAPHSAEPRTAPAGRRPASQDAARRSDPDSLPPFGEQAIDMAPPPEPTRWSAAR
ncbi:hypothetical protein [Krasilnikovia sp. MM14-A1259]|uniref:hypothetical protein n=1 Tax=Krasilnikovia sp. MM14-A1259 TaxID=3373539 RepID=UPI0037F92DD4